MQPEAGEELDPDEDAALSEKVRTARATVARAMMNIRRVADGGIVTKVITRSSATPSPEASSRRPSRTARRRTGAPMRDTASGSTATPTERTSRSPSRSPASVPARPQQTSRLSTWPRSSSAWTGRCSPSSTRPSSRTAPSSTPRCLTDWPWGRPVGPQLQPGPVLLWRDRAVHPTADHTEPDWFDDSPDGECVITEPRRMPVAVSPWGGRMIDEVRAHIATHDLSRALREIGVKRELLDAYAEVAAKGTDETEYADGLRLAVRLLGLAYADRPGYRDEWAP